MKRFFPILLLSAMAVLMLLFTGCSADKEDAKLTIKESISANYEALTEALAHTDDFQQLSDYLSGWAKDNQIDVKTSNNKYIVLSKAASSGYEDAPTFTFHSSVILDDEKEKDDSLQTSAAAMTALYSAENHGTLKSIFTLEEKGAPSGASALSSEYLKSDNFIELTHGSDTAVINSTAASSTILASKDLDMVSPQYTKAYKITLKGTGYKSPYQYRGDYPNAIKTIGDLLASCQSSSVLFELASFKGGESADLYPMRAAAVIVLQENDVESFTKRFERSYENVQKYYDDVEEPFEYTMTETKMPKQVIAKEDAGNIVSLMYTITNGTYLKSDDGQVMAASNIGRVSTKNQHFRMKIDARSMENNLMDEMYTVFETTCGLCDIKYSVASSHNLWYSPEKTPLIKVLSDRFNTKPTGMMEEKSAFIFLKKNPKLNMVILKTNKKDASKGLSALLNYMEYPQTDQN